MSNITTEQKKVLDLMPNTRKNIAEELGISRRACRYRMKTLEEDHGYEFYMTSDHVWHEVDADNDSKRSEEPKRINSYNKAQATKEVHNELTELEKEVKKALNNTEPVTTRYNRSASGSTLVLPHSDAHVGSVVQDRYDVDYYGAEEARKAIREFVDKGIAHANRRGC